jgi:hypothetical protein
MRKVTIKSDLVSTYEDWLSKQTCTTFNMKESFLVSKILALDLACMIMRGMEGINEQYSELLNLREQVMHEYEIHMHKEYIDFNEDKLKLT